MNCALCGEPLKNRPTNLEHYVHQVLIRNFDILGIPDRYTHARRARDSVLPISAHKRWATVPVHTDCNSAWSYIGEAFKYIIDHIDQKLDVKRTLILFKYYALLWGADPYDIRVTILSERDNEIKYSNKRSNIIYEPFLLSCGRIEIDCPKARAGVETRDLASTIHIGEPQALERL